MELVKRLQLEIDKGFSKSELERIVELPLNTLSSILTGKKKMTAKHELSVSSFLDKNPNLNPLDYPKRTRRVKEQKKGKDAPPKDETKKDTPNPKNLPVNGNPQMPKGLSLIQQLEWREKNGK